MKRFSVLSLSLILVLAAFVLGGQYAFARGEFRPMAAAGAPTVVSYQGQVTVDGTPYDGTGYFKFAVVDQAGTTTYWSSDATSTSGGNPPTL
jgi:hypothetical protein